jgi:hypothetical protein
VIDLAAFQVVEKPAFGEPWVHALENHGHGMGVATMIANPIRWWTLRAFGHTPLARGADRVEAWSVFVGLIMLIVAVYPAMALGEAGYAARSHTNAAEAATRHSVDAVAIGNGKSNPTVSGAVPTTFSVQVRWLAQNTTREAEAKVDRAVKAGDPVNIWVDDRGNITTAPLTDDDIHVVAIGTAALVWLAAAVILGAVFAMLHGVLDRSRNRGWDRGLHELVRNGGGSANFPP